MLNGTTLKTTGSHCDILEGGPAVINITKSYSFKKVPSIIVHKSPTDEEYGAELSSMVTPSLPADRDRYVDFIGSKGDYVKILYPNLYRITLTRSELTYAGAKNKIKQVLDAKSNEIGNLVIQQNPATLSGKSGEIAKLLATGVYPLSKIDVYKTLAALANGTTSASQIDLYGMLAANPKALEAAVQGVLWKNLDNVTLKYSSILEHSLDIDGQKNISADDRQNDYEIATLGAPGDAKNMYVKIDPAAK